MILGAFLFGFHWQVHCFELQNFGILFSSKGVFDLLFGKKIIVMYGFGSICF